MIGLQGAGAKPLLIRVATWPSMVIGALFFLMAVATALGCGDTSRLTASPFGEWGVSLWIAQAAVLGGFLFAIGYGFKRDETWTRVVVIVYWIAAIAFSAANAIASGIPRGTYFIGLTSFLGLGIAWWFFFSKPNVVAYYRSLAGVKDAARA